MLSATIEKYYLQKARIFMAFDKMRLNAIWHSMHTSQFECHVNQKSSNDIDRWAKLKSSFWEIISYLSRGLTGYPVGCLKKGLTIKHFATIAQCREFPVMCVCVFVRFEIFIRLETETFGAKLQFTFVMLLQLFNFLIGNFMQRPIVSRRFQKCIRQECL